jgi:ribonuclease E
MANKMLIDTTHPEETRVVVLRGNRVEEFDFESANRRQLRGNIYLAKVTRVEPSLQAAFIDYGGNRHGFLAFSEIHPDYYQIPVADRQALIAEEERAHRDAEDEADRRASGGRGDHGGGHGGRNRRPRRDAAHGRRDHVLTQPLEESASNGHDGAAADAQESYESGFHENQGAHETHETHGTGSHAGETQEGGEPHETQHDHSAHDRGAHDHAAHESTHPEQPAVASEAVPESRADERGNTGHAAEAQPAVAQHHEEEHHEEIAAAGAMGDAPAPEAVSATDENAPHGESPNTAPDASENGSGEIGAEIGSENAGNGNIEEVDDRAGGENGDEEDEVVESVGGADALEEVQERTPRYRRTYKIQEVIKRRQIMLVQVVKEERGTKGAALTTYLSLAGRYSVLMPNTARGGGISRKITQAIDRKRLKEIAQELEVPEGMGVILRTAGANRTKQEVKRDFEYLLRMWETVRDYTLKSTAPKLVYEEGSLIKRSIRDLYNKDIEEILVAGEEGHREARDFMRMLMPSHAKNVILYNDPQPIFTRYGIESQLDAMFTPTVQLRSGGYIVINQTEALVAIDVNSGRATREHHIEDTATKTNSEAAEEIARQLRLRDLAGLIVIDFIDMDESRNNRTVERRMKESLKHDRARIQVGRISHFGLLEMSRQRIRSSVLESSTDKCPHCGGSGHVRSVSSVTLHLLRMLEEMLIKGATHNLIVRTRTEVALYALNHKRAHLRDLESRFQITITVNADANATAAQPFTIEKGELVHSVEDAKAILAQISTAPVLVRSAEDESDEFVEDEVEEIEAESEADGDDEAESEDEGEGEARAEAAPAAEGSEDEGQRRGRRRRRGRGGRGRDRDGQGGREPREGLAAAPGDAASQNGALDDDDGEGAGDEGEQTETNADGSPLSADAAGEAERRRRRRGRRGGRRNRRGRDGEAPYAGADAPQDAVEPDVASAVADLNGGSPAERPAHPPYEPPAHSREQQGHEQTSFPSAAEPMAAHEAAPAAEMPADQPRRRSTVREPAPMFSSGSMSDVQPSSVQPSPLHEAPPPAPEPVATIPQPDAAPAPDSEAKPRRFGWWNRRG